MLLDGKNDRDFMDGRVDGHLLAIGHVPCRRYSSVIKVLEVVHPYLCCSPGVPAGGRTTLGEVERSLPC